MRKTLSTADMAEQYPLNAAEAFLGTAGCWFDIDALARYAEKAREPEVPGRVHRLGRRGRRPGRPQDARTGMIRVWDAPEKGREYAIYIDVATGRGQGLHVADGHRPDEHEHRRRAARQDRPRPARRAGCTSSGAGTTPPASRSRWAAASGSRSSSPCATASRGASPYPKLYRHVQDDRPDFKQNITYGFPITTKTRPLIINALEVAIREEALPHIPMETILECKTFVRRDTLPSPRAAEGCNDDRVMSLAGALEMYRRYGYHPLDVRTSRKTEEARVPA